MSDEDEEAISRVIDQLIQCGLLIEGEITEGVVRMQQLRCVRSSLTKRAEDMELQRRINSRQRGRLTITISSQQAIFFLEHGCKISDIASLFGCSRRTVERRLQEVGLSVRRSYSQISDYNLFHIVNGMTARNPRIGEKIVDGLLRAQGVVQRQLVREALHTVDPQGSQRRMRRALNRREYHVECPNALWHIDGYHKLIRWGIVCTVLEMVSLQMYSF